MPVTVSSRGGGTLAGSVEAAAYARTGGGGTDARTALAQHMRAREAEAHLQGVRGCRHLRTREAEAHLHGVRGQRHLCTREGMAQLRQTGVGA